MVRALHKPNLKQHTNQLADPHSAEKPRVRQIRLRRAEEAGQEAENAFLELEKDKPVAGH